MSSRWRLADLMYLLAFAVCLLLVPVLALAAPEVAAGVSGPDWGGLLTLAVNGLIPVVVMLLVSLARAVQPRIPRFTLPLLAMALGPTLAALFSYVSDLAKTQAQVNWVAALLLGALATVLHELQTTYQQHGLTGS